MRPHRQLGDLALLLLGDARRDDVMAEPGGVLCLEVVIALAPRDLERRQGLRSLHPEHPDGDLDAGLGRLDQRGAIGTRSRQRSLDAVEDGVLVAGECKTEA